MYLCNDGHDEICYEGKQCPLCECKSKVLQLEDDLSDKEDEVRKLQDEVDDLQRR